MRHHISLGLDDLRTVVALAEELNYHRAARRVGKTQSGVTRVVARVERHVGTRLFERSHSKNRSVSTTDAGILYVARARLAIAHSESAELAARDSLHGVTHQISVGKSVFTDRRLVTILRSIELPLHPGLEVLLHTRSPAELPACVRSGEFDLAVVSNSVEDSLLSGTVIRCVPFTVVLPEGHSCAAKDSVTLKDLCSTPWVLFERHLHPALYDSFLNRARELEIRVERIHHIADAEEACESVRLYGGAAFLSPQGAERAATDEVILRTLAEKQVYLKTQLLARSENSSKLVAEFVRTFVKRLKQAGLYRPSPWDTADTVQRIPEFRDSLQALPVPLDRQQSAERSKTKVCAA